MTNREAAARQEGQYPRSGPLHMRRLRRVLLALLSDADNLGGWTICWVAQVGTRTTYPVLWRLEALGWVEAHWEELPEGDTRPRRRFYRLTAMGRAEAETMLHLSFRRWS